MVPELQQGRGRKAGLDDDRRRQTGDDLVPQGDLVRITRVLLKPSHE
jgi:hypothetical protein